MNEKVNLPKKKRWIKALLFKQKVSPIKKEELEQLNEIRKAYEKS